MSIFTKYNGIDGYVNDIVIGSLLGCSALGFLSGYGLGSRNSLKGGVVGATIPPVLAVTLFIAMTKSKQLDDDIFKCLHGIENNQINNSENDNL